MVFRQRRKCLLIDGEINVREIKHDLIGRPDGSPVVRFPLEKIEPRILLHHNPDTVESLVRVLGAWDTTDRIHSRDRSMAEKNFRVVRVFFHVTIDWGAREMRSCILDY